MNALSSLAAIASTSVLALSSACGGAAESEPTDPTPNGIDGGAETSVDSPDGEAAAAESPFAGAPAYVPTTGRNTLQPGEHPGYGNPSKRACFDCHGGNGPGPKFFAAGSVFHEAAGTTAAAEVEIRLRDDAGRTVSTYTDALGNFVVTARAASTAGVTFPLHAGARDATTTNAMIRPVPNGNCNAAICHGGPRGWIHVP